MQNAGKYTGGLLIFILVLAVVTPTEQCGAENAPGELTLLPVSGKDIANILTPQRMLSDGKKVQFQGASGTIDAGGKSYKVVGSKQRGMYFLAVDGNNDGNLDNKEIHPVSRKSNSLLVSLENPIVDTTGGEDTAQEQEKEAADEENAAEEDAEADASAVSYDFVLNNVTMLSRGDQVAAVGFNLYPAWGMRVKYQNTTITLIDTNMDGLFTQDGSDAIATSTRVAVPLKKIHRIGRGIYALTVSEDGSTITLQQRLFRQGAIQLAKPTPLWQGLIIENDDAAFDVLQDGKAGIPAGKYRILCGKLSRGKEAAFITKAPSYDLRVKAGRKHKLRIGPPAELEFQMNLVNGNVTISPNSISVVGAAGETYRFNTQRMEPPSIFILAGGNIIQRDRMVYGREGEFRTYSRRIPKGFENKSISIAMACKVPVFGNVRKEKKIHSSGGSSITNIQNTTMKQPTNPNPQVKQPQVNFPNIQAPKPAQPLQTK